MKRLIILIVLFASIQSLPGANNAKAQAFTRGNLYINAGVSFLYNPYRPSNLWYWNNYNYSSTPPLIASMEYGINEMFSVGGYVSHRSYGWDYRSGNFFYEYSHRRMSFGGRFSFHYLPLVNELLGLGMDEEHLDFYVTGIVGINTHTYSETEPTYKTTTTDLSPFVGPVLGFRYMFNNNLGAYLEGGRGSLGFANIGLTLKL